MATILSIIQNVTLAIGLDRPTAVFSSTEREHLELCRLANYAAETIRDACDWQTLQVMNTFTGDGTKEEFTLPDDYDRMKADANVWSSRWTWAFNHITSSDTWLEYQVVPYTFINGNWSIFGGDFHVLPLMATAETVKFFYVSKWAVNGKTQELFTADTDTWDLNDRLLELCMIWLWRAGKGLPYDEDLASYNDKKTKEMDKDGGSKPTLSGNPMDIGRRGATIWAFPQTVGQ